MMSELGWFVTDLEVHLTGVLYPDDFPEDPVAEVTPAEVEELLANLGKAPGWWPHETWEEQP